MEQRRFIHVDGGVWEGDWVNDKANGYGNYICKKGIYMKENGETIFKMVSY